MCYCRPLASALDSTRPCPCHLTCPPADALLPAASCAGDVPAVQPERHPRLLPPLPPTLDAPSMRGWVPRLLACPPAQLALATVPVQSALDMPPMLQACCVSSRASVPAGHLPLA
jgi:hypothetical protein